MDGREQVLRESVRERKNNRVSSTPSTHQQLQEDGSIGLRQHVAELCEVVDFLLVRDVCADDIKDGVVEGKCAKGFFQLTKEDLGRKEKERNAVQNR